MGSPQIGLRLCASDCCAATLTCIFILAEYRCAEYDIILTVRPYQVF